MAIFYVHQGDTFLQERQGGFVWSPVKNKSGNSNIGFSNMAKIQKGDFIMHHAGRYIKCIGVAQTNCYGHNKPSAIQGGWATQGHRVDVDYYDLDTPLCILDYSAQISTLPNYEIGKAFTHDGKPTQHYMCVLTVEQAEFILKLILPSQNTPLLKQVIKDALAVVSEDFDVDHDGVSVEAEIESRPLPVSPIRNGQRKPIETTTSASTNRVIPKRNVTVAVNALCIANHECEVNQNHKTFMRKVSKLPYMESHHLVPISRFRDFRYSLDIEENIISLCPTCHRLLHHGSMSEKEVILKKLYKDRISMLRRCGIDLSYKKLKEYYE